MTRWNYVALIMASTGCTCYYLSQQYGIPVSVRYILDISAALLVPATALALIIAVCRWKPSNRALMLRAAALFLCLLPSASNDIPELELYSLARYCKIDRNSLWWSNPHWRMIGLTGNLYSRYLNGQSEKEGQCVFHWSRINNASFGDGSIQ